MRAECLLRDRTHDCTDPSSQKESNPEAGSSRVCASAYGTVTERSQVPAKQDPGFSLPRGAKGRPPGGERQGCPPQSTGGSQPPASAFGGDPWAEGREAKLQVQRPPEDREPWLEPVGREAGAGGRGAAAPGAGGRLWPVGRKLEVRAKKRKTVS